MENENKYLSLNGLKRYTELLLKTINQNTQNPLELGKLGETVKEDDNGSNDL